MAFNNMCPQDTPCHDTVSAVCISALPLVAVLPIKPLSCATTCWEPAGTNAGVAVRLDGWASETLDLI